MLMRTVAREGQSLTKLQFNAEGLNFSALVVVVDCGLASFTRPPSSVRPRIEDNCGHVCIVKGSLMDQPPPSQERADP